MFEEKTYEALLQNKLARVPSTLDKREGSIIFNALAPNSIESAMLYAALDSVLNETFADTASREYLIKRCAERGIVPMPATAPVGIGQFNISLPIGTRFTCGQYAWYVSEEFEGTNYYMTCETTGSAPNAVIGALIPVEYIDGLTSANLINIEIPGKNEESTESLRLRYFNSFNNQSYGFNRAQYIEVTESYDGVGHCKPYRAWDGPGTVKLVITNSDNYSAPSETLVQAVQEQMDPTQDGEGLGDAPIDHVVTVAPAKGAQIDITANITFAEGYSFATCEDSINSALDAYYYELNSTWQDRTILTVRASQIITRLAGLPEIVDITITGLTDPTGNSERHEDVGNLVLNDDAVAVRGVFTSA